MAPMTTTELEARVLEQEWFYRFELPSGAFTRQYISEEVNHIHTTRKQMMLDALGSDFKENGDRLTAIDLSSHQGFFPGASAALQERTRPRATGASRRLSQPYTRRVGRRKRQFSSRESRNDDPRSV